MQLSLKIVWKGNFDLTKSTCGTSPTLERDTECTWMAGLLTDLYTTRLPMYSERISQRASALFHSGIMCRAMEASQQRDCTRISLVSLLTHTTECSHKHHRCKFSNIMVYKANYTTTFLSLRVIPFSAAARESGRMGWFHPAPGWCWL